QLGEPVPEQLARVAEGDLERERRPAGERVERLAKLGEPGRALARQERLAEDDELGVERVELGLQHRCREDLRRRPGSERERVRRRKRDDSRAGERRDVALGERLAQARLARGRGRRAIEAVRVQEPRERAGLETFASLEERPEEVLPAQHPVGEQVEAGLLLDADELVEVAPDLLVDRLGGRATAIEVARRLDERLRAGI